ncbi:glycosyltransferase family 4 protein [Rhodocyclus tenuis]|uniref:Glycosyltransferase family 4 protein n=1 Tax=Rhodocyclus gracilis TaxID=2929842 RepID=A0ABX0WKZ7_9RHOO|nr:glycosyltransferase family 4 protein [Rhodocyclus gracilis]MRD72308.1 glycosyltransferase [Rhodocyclus gracilis]NJA89603.1 glycosyltransferase family 4 protein [Rhodocyclus gracilis]
MNSAKLKIAFLGAIASPHVVARALAFVRLGHEVKLVSPASTEYSTVRLPFNVESPRPYCGFVVRLSSIFYLVLALRSQIYFAHFASEITTWVAWLLRKRPLVISVMGGDVLFGEQSRTRWYNRFLTIKALRSADLVIAKSEQLVEVVERLGVHPERIMQVYWGIESDVFRPRRDARLRCLDGWCIDRSSFVIFSPRMLQPLYNQMTMVEALPRIIASVPQAILALSTYGEDRNYRAQVSAVAEAGGVSDRLVFVDGRDRMEMPEAYSAADVVLSLPVSDGFPQSVLEAMGCHVPVVMSDLPHFRELIEDESHALLVSVDASHVADAVIRLATDEALRCSLVSRAAELVSRVADIDAAAQRVETRIFDLLKPK